MSRVEEWVPIKGYESYYLISNTGLVKSLHERNYGNILKTWDNQRGYLFCNLYVKGRKVNGYIHRLVAEHFLIKTKTTDVVNHIDGDRKNNNVSNLEWCSHQENINHASSMGKIKKGEETHFVKLTEDQIREIRRLYKHKIYNQKELSFIYKVNSSGINRIIKRTLWKHVD